MIATRDVAEMLVGGALHDGAENLLIESGGLRWLTWREIADTVAAKVGRKSIRVVPLRAWFARLNQWMARPFSAAAANTFALMSFVASHEPRRESVDAMRKLDLPPQFTLPDYLDENCVARFGNATAIVGGESRRGRSSSQQPY